MTLSKQVAAMMPTMTRPLHQPARGQRYTQPRPTSRLEASGTCASLFVAPARRRLGLGEVWRRARLLLFSQMRYHG